MSLLPLPSGMVPSLKVAYRGGFDVEFYSIKTDASDPDFSVGFQQVDEFVNVREIGVGSVAFPYNHKYALTRKLKLWIVTLDFTCLIHRNTSLTIVPVQILQRLSIVKMKWCTLLSPSLHKLCTAPRNTRDLFFENVNHSPVVEVARKTMEIEKPDDNERDSPGYSPSLAYHNRLFPVFADYSMEDDLLRAIPIISPQRADPENVLPSEVKEYIPMDDSIEVDGIYGHLEDSLENLIETEERPVEMRLEAQITTRKSSSRVSSTKKQGDNVDNSASKIAKEKTNSEEKKKKNVSSLKNKKVEERPKPKKVFQPIYGSSKNWNFSAMRSSSGCSHRKTCHEKVRKNAKSSRSELYGQCGEHCWTRTGTRNRTGSGTRTRTTSSA